MTIFALVALFVVFVTVLFAPAFFIGQKWGTFCIPVALVVGFILSAYSTQYEGYAVSSALIPDGAEAAVVSVTQGTEAIYVVARFSGETQPRLVKFPADEESQKELSKNKTSSVMVIKFGKQEAGQTGNGKEAGGHQAPFKMIDLKDSKMGKTE